jgi:hypothetical protein
MKAARSASFEAYSTDDLMAYSTLERSVLAEKA